MGFMPGMCTAGGGIVGRRSLETETVSKTAVHILVMNKTKLTQTMLLLAALTIGLLNQQFNGLSLLALGMVAAAGWLTWGRGTDVPRPAAE